VSHNTCIGVPINAILRRRWLPGDGRRERLSPPRAAPPGTLEWPPDLRLCSDQMSL
jgi:hypothetical protein